MIVVWIPECFLVYKFQTSMKTHRICNLKTWLKSVLSRSQTTPEGSLIPKPPLKVVLFPDHP